MSDDELSPSKRLCFDPEATPRKGSVAKPSEKPSLASESDWSSTTSSRSKRNRSGRASPTKGLAVLRIGHIINHHSLDGDKAPPQELDELVQILRQDAMGLGILTPSDMNAIKSSAQGRNLFRNVLRQPHLVDNTDQRHELGQLPPIDILVDIWEEAQKCERKGHSEASWNCAVHYPLLKAALRYAKVNRKDGTNAKECIKNFEISTMNVTTAQIVQRYAPSTMGTRHDKRVDFCVYIDPLEGSPLSDSLYQAAQASPHLSINHTDYTPLINCPISLSIETKRTGEGWQAALAQTSIWLSAQWKRLQELAQVSDGTDSLAFLPAIIVQGHDWMFIAATRGDELDKGMDRETIIWSKVLLGSTDGFQGICQIVTVLQRLAGWSAETYWHWFQDKILQHRSQH